MCDYFLQRMEGDQAGGDLTDIVRAGGAMPGNAEVPPTGTEWQLQGEPSLLFPPPPSSSDGWACASADVFADPFSGLRDPFSSDYSSGADFFLDAMPDAMAKAGFDTAVGGRNDCGGGGGGGQLLDTSGRKPLLPRGGVQMPAVGLLGPWVLPSPLSPRAIRPYPPMGGDMVKLGITPGQMAGCAIDAAVAGMQMSSPRAAAGGIKRRKNQARKVVCVPAPAGGRPTGEVVPSDLWAWRKYGQKPIKGSPYPRGYYRCSSSKGCSARKQVERSRTDPNMLVITYTSEHNHPWPTQRNALAGSTRNNHHGKNGGSSSGSKNSKNEKRKQPNVKEESKEQQATTTTTTSAITNTATTSTSPVAAVKEEALAGSEALWRVTDTTGAADHNNIALMDYVFSESYKPMIPEAGQSDDFFSDLAELESDPMSLIFSKEYMQEGTGGGDDHAEAKVISSKDSDPFEMLDWSNTSSAGSSFEQGKIG